MVPEAGRRSGMRNRKHRDPAKPHNLLGRSLRPKARGPGHAGNAEVSNCVVGNELAVLSITKLPDFSITQCFSASLWLCGDKNEMTTNSKIWVSELNARPEIRGAFPRTKIHFYDTTLPGWGGTHTGRPLLRQQKNKTHPHPR